MARKTALVVAPGRGTYNKEELGYLRRHHPGRDDLLAGFDAQREAQGQATISALDGADRFVLSTYSRGDNASGLIYACAYADFLAIDRDRYDVVAVTGNSMGWYIALACGGAVNAEDGFRIVNTMGTLMQDSLIGGQILYPFVDEEWRAIPGKREELLALTEEIDGLHLSIALGGMIVFAGEEPALAAVEAKLPAVGGRFPMRLANHAAFHTPLQAPVAARGQAALGQELFASPAIPLIDGRGEAWFPLSTDVGALRDYTLGHQVTEAYDFTRAIQNGLREFAPDAVIVLGPGATLGGAVAQVLIANEWRGLGSKSDFVARQSADPLLLSMGMPAQRALVTG
jgi:acyl transferase domain-containing protein